MERTFVIIKPDAVQRGLIGEIITAFERKGLKVLGLKLLHITESQAERQYAIHKGKAFYDSLVKFMTSGPCVALALEGRNAIHIVRKLVGATDPAQSEPGSLRGRYSVDMKHNLIHASDSPESVKHELPIFFSEQELMAYEMSYFPWLYSQVV